MDKYIHAFWQIKGNSYQNLFKIDQYFGGFDFAWDKADQTELKRAGLNEEYAKEVIRLRKNLDLNKCREQLWLQDIFLIDRKCPEFPEQLRNIFQPPFLLYRKGARIDELSNRVAIVGMRKSSIEGEKLAFSLARTLGNRGLTIVSGLAFGIDAAAHQGALESSGKTIGVLASGINKITPSSHYNLAQSILSRGGAIISEYPVTVETWKYHFLERNRLIAGLCHTVIVVEAAKKSGALITANCALEQGKEIIAFPGSPGRWQSQGCNNLIKEGKAQLADSIGDIIQSLEDRGLLTKSEKKTQQEKDFDETDMNILEMMKRGPISTDEIENCFQGQRQKMLNSLCVLEMAGLIHKNSSMKWQLLAN